MSGWLRGFFDGEGHVRFGRVYRRDSGHWATCRYVAVGNTDIHLLARCCEYLSALGIHYTRFNEIRREGRKPFSTLHIVREKDLLLFIKHVGLSAPRKVAALRLIEQWIKRDRMAVWSQRREFMLDLWKRGHSCRCISRRLGFKEGGHAKVGWALRRFGINAVGSSKGKKHCCRPHTGHRS